MVKSVLVTGTSTGFGLETALALAEHGFQVYATMRDLARRDRLDDAARRRNVTVRVLRLDITDQSTIDEAVQSIVDECGSIYGLVNNAGSYVRGYFEDLLDEECRQVIETNVFGTMAVTRAVLPHMRGARTGRIVIMSSIAGLIGGPTSCAYSASRFALEGFGESLRQEVEPLGIYVSLVEPGISMTEAWSVERGAGVRARDPNSPYAPWFRRVERMFGQTLASSPNRSNEVAAAVYHALTDRRPRLRYLVAPKAAPILALRRHIPGELFERFYFGEVMRRVTRAR